MTWVHLYELWLSKWEQQKVKKGSEREEKPNAVSTAQTKSTVKESAKHIKFSIAQLVYVETANAVGNSVDGK